MAEKLLAVDVELKGAPELEKALKRLSAVTRGNVIKKGVSAALTPIAREARRRVWVKSGDTRRAIGKKTRKFPNHFVWGAVGIKRGMPGSPHLRAHLQEFGTVHARANPFMQSSMAAKRAEALAILRAKVASAIEAARKKGLK